MFIHTADIQTPTDAISALPAVESTHIVITFIWEVIFSIEICVLYRSGASFFVLVGISFFMGFVGAREIFVSISGFSYFTLQHVNHPDSVYTQDKCVFASTSAVMSQLVTLLFCSFSTCHII